MLVNLYGNYGLIFQSLATGFNEAHAENNLKFSVVKKDDLDAKFTEAVKKAYNAKFLDDADAIIRFAEPVQAQPEQGQEEQGGQEEPPPEEGNGEEAPSPKPEDNGEQNQEEAPPSPPPENDNKKEQPPEENAGAEDDKKEQAQEEKPDEKSDDKKDNKKEDKPKDEKKDDKKEKVNESENATDKSGAELKKQIIDTITRRLFQKEDEKVEVFDLQGYMDGYNVSFVKLSFGEGEKKNG